MNHLIIDRPDLQTPIQRFISRSLTLILWLIYFYLWLPLLTLLAWWVGLTGIARELSAIESSRNLQLVLFTYLLVVLAIGFVYLLWAILNYRKFRNHEKRKTRSSVPLNDIAEYHRVSPTDLSNWQNIKSLIVDHDEHGSIISAEPHNKQPVQPTKIKVII